MNLKFFEHSPYTELLSTYTKIFNPGLIFFGHGVTQQIKDPVVQRVQLKYNDFVRAIEFMEKLTYRFISMEQFQEIAKSKTKVNYPWVHLTFDDGYKNNLTEIYPYLKQKNIPFTLFASMHHIINNKRFDTDRIAIAIKHTINEGSLLKLTNSLNITGISVERSKLIDLVIKKYKYQPVEQKIPFLEEICELLDEKEWDTYNNLYDSEAVLTVEELKLLNSDPLVHIGSHGCNHYIQSTLTEKERMFELEHSKELLKQILGNDTSTFCYPNGGEKDFSGETSASCVKANYSHCFTTIPRAWKPNRNNMEIPRFAFTYSYLPQALIKAPFK